MKALPIAGIVGSLFAALAIAVLVPDTLAMFVPLLVGLVGSGILVGQRSLWGVIVGLVVLALTTVAALGLVGNVSTKEGETNFAVSVGTGQVLAILVCLALPAAAIGLRWDDAVPRWLTLAALACAAVAFIIAASDPDGIAQQNQVGTDVAAVLALLSLVGMVPLLRAEDGAEDVAVASAPLASAESTVGGPAAAKPSTPPGKGGPSGRRP